jgi:transposase InsO family protein
MTGVLGVSRSAYYKWASGGGRNSRDESDAELLIRVRQIVADHQRRYGSLRVMWELRNKYGIRVSRKRIAKLLRKHGLNARRRRKWIVTTNSNHGLRVCGNVLNREFTATVPGEKWVSDLTYLRTREGWLYLTIVLDLWDRQVVGFSFSEEMTTAETTVKALSMAVGTRKPKGDLLFHSDRGIQYCAGEFRDALKAYCPAVRQSMSRKGNCWDNACAESFFKTLKGEVEGLEGGLSRAQVRTLIFEYIVTYYNKRRIHSSLDYMAPDEVVSGQVA